MSEMKRKRGGRLFRRVIAIVTLALAIILADILSPYIKNWVYAVLPRVDYQSAAVRLTHEMEKVGELIAVRHTDTGVMNGKVEALFLGTVSEVSVPYRYEIGLGVKLGDVKLEPEENSLIVSVPQAQVLYDHFQATGEPQNNDFWGFATQQRYQKMLDEQHAACRAGYESDPAFLSEAWEVVCEQLTALFHQWSGENLQLRFVREGQ